MSKRETIDLKPTWSAMLPALLAVLQDGTEEGKRIARTELARMARVADLYVRLHPREPKRRQSPTRRELIVSTLESAGRPMHVNAVSKVTGIRQPVSSPARSFYAPHPNLTGTAP